MSRKSRERRAKNKGVRSDEYFTNGFFEMARFGKNTVVRNNLSSEQHAKYMEHLSSEYVNKREIISKKVESIKEKVLQCDPYLLLMYLRSVSISGQMNIFSESQFSQSANSLIRAQEYVQSILVSTPNEYIASKENPEQETLYTQIINEFEELYKEFTFFYHYWAAHIEKNTNIEKDRINDIVEAQMMYWVRGNRYQFFELEPIKYLLPPHDAILQELFGVSFADIISGLDKLRYSLSQGIADSMNAIMNSYVDFMSSIDSGMSIEEAIEFARNDAIPVVGKVFGDDLVDVAAITNWDSRFIDTLSYELGECTTFYDESEFSGWPIISLPVMRKPFIKINGKVYAFLYYALFDNIYRIIQKNIFSRKPEYVASWKDKQCESSEKMVKDLFLKMLPGAEVHIGNYYPAKTSLKQMNENDIIIVFQNYLFVIEVKAGSFPNTPPISDFEAHVKAYHALAEVADSQCSRTLNYISKNKTAQFYDENKNTTFSIPNISSFDDVFTFSVTVDNFNEFAAKAEKLSVISLKEQTIVISIDDLLVYAEYFDSPIQFIHYLKQRKAAMTVPQFQMHDEFDHLGLYIERNLYAINPEQYSDVNNVFWEGFREPLDEYFSLLFVKPEIAVKPIQKYPREINEIHQWLDNNMTQENIQLGLFILNFASDARNGFADQINYIKKRQQEVRIMIPAVAFGDISYCLFIEQPSIKCLSNQAQSDYTYAAASRNEQKPMMRVTLTYDEKGKLIKVSSQKHVFTDLSTEEAVRLRILGDQKARERVELAKRKRGKIGRNEVCPCGSGKKYKQCCISETSEIEI